MIKSVHCSPRGTRDQFIAHTLSHSATAVTPAPRKLMPSSGLLGYCTHLADHHKDTNTDPNENKSKNSKLIFIAMQVSEFGKNNGFHLYWLPCSSRKTPC